MLNTLIFANSLATTVVIFRIIAVALAILVPDLFGFTIRSLSLGLISNYQKPDFIDVIVSILVPAIAVWILAYTWASLYNRWSAQVIPRPVEKKVTTKKRSRRK
jgi:hypothetical protein